MNNLEKILVELENAEYPKSFYPLEKLIGYLAENISFAVENQDWKMLRTTYALLKQYGYYGEEYRDVRDQREHS